MYFVGKCECHASLVYKVLVAFHLKAGETSDYTHDTSSYFLISSQFEGVGANFLNIDEFSQYYISYTFAVKATSFFLHRLVHIIIVRPCIRLPMLCTELPKSTTVLTLFVMPHLRIVKIAVYVLYRAIFKYSIPME